MSQHKKFWKNSRRAYRILIVLCILALISGIVIFFVNDGFESSIDKGPNGYTELPENNPKRAENREDPDRIKNGIHVRTGLVDVPGLQETVNNCTNCHSAKLVMQNRMNAERWHATIRWMQETQNLWPLGENEDIIVDYLVTNYPPQKKGRRGALADVEWYDLSE